MIVLYTLSVIIILTTAFLSLVKMLTDESLSSPNRIAFFLSFLFCALVVWLLAIGGRAYIGQESAAEQSEVVE